MSGFGLNSLFCLRKRHDSKAQQQQQSKAATAIVKQIWFNTPSFKSRGLKSWFVNLVIVIVKSPLTEQYKNEQDKIFLNMDNKRKNNLCRLSKVFNSRKFTRINKHLMKVGEYNGQNIVITIKR